MLSLTCISLLLQLISKSTPQTKSIHIENYWKTTYVTDQVPDYWNHGPIYVPGHPFGKKPDIFPAWLPKKETSGTTETSGAETQVSVGETTSPETDMTIIITPPTQEETTSLETDMTIIIPPPTQEETTYPETDTTIIIPPPTQEETTSPETDTTIIITPPTQEEYTTLPEEETLFDVVTTTHDKESNTTRLETPTAARQSTVALETTFYDEYNKTEQTTESVTPTTTIPSSTRAYLQEIEPVIRAIERESTTDPFSVFMRKMLIILTIKKNEDLPLLIDQFREYVSMLLTGGQLNMLGIQANSYIATRLLILEKYPMQALKNLFDELQKKLAQRNKKLPKEVNDILDYTDDTYDEAEEEAMQAVLRETYLYPNTKNYNKIAQGFVDYVFLKPLTRVAKTSRGNVLFEMIKDALLKLAKPADMLQQAFNENLRKSFKKTQKVRHESSSTDTEENISSERNKEEDIDLSDISSNCLSERSETTSSGEENDSSNERRTRKNYRFNNNKLVKSENFKKHKNRITSRKVKSHEVFSKLRPINRKQYGDFDNNGDIRRHSYQHILSSTFTTNDANVIKATESSDIEMVLKSKIYDSLRRMDYVNYDTSRTLKHRLTSQVNEFEKSSESDVERELKRNIYKAVNKWLNK